MSKSSQTKPRTLLIITCSGGGGLIQAANAKEQEARSRDPELKIVRRDVFKDWIWFKLGHLFAHIWNEAQIRGNVAFQSFCVWGQLLVDRFFWPIFFFSALITLFKEDVDEIIDTQNMGTSAIVNALRVFNFKKKKQVRIKKVLVDLPTKKATHFFWPIKNLSKKNRKLIQLVTIQPLLEKGETAEEFWQANCHLSNGDILYEDLNVRQTFRKYQGMRRKKEAMKIKIRYKSDEELSLMRKSFEKGALRSEIGEDGIEFIIPPEDRVITVLLGSQPGSDATYKYAERFLQEASALKIPTHLFIFCADHIPNEETLFRKVVDVATKTQPYPIHFSMIPFSFQADDVIAPLFFRSDLTCTRSGGQTAMELMCVGRGEIWIHSETKKNGEKEPALEEMLKGIPGWEAANALYMQKVRGAKIVSPDTFIPYARQLLRSDDRQGRSNRYTERPLESTA